MVSSRIPPPYRELARRFNDGLEVTLFWQKLTDELTITVSDERRGDYFELTAAPDEALNVFNHPYAYAASAAWHMQRHCRLGPTRRTPLTLGNRPFRREDG